MSPTGKGFIDSMARIKKTVKGTVAELHDLGGKRRVIPREYTEATSRFLERKGFVDRSPHSPHKVGSRGEASPLPHNFIDFGYTTER
jgi:hypothetical protein